MYVYGCLSITHLKLGDPKSHRKFFDVGNLEAYAADDSPERRFRRAGENASLWSASIREHSPELGTAKAACSSVKYLSVQQIASVSIGDGVGSDLSLQQEVSRLQWNKPPSDGAVWGSGSAWWLYTRPVGLCEWAVLNFREKIFERRSQYE